jgi:penicillin-binding protein 1A
MARKKSGGERIEPGFAARADSSRAPRVEGETRGARRTPRNEKPARGKNKGSGIGKLVYWGFVLAIWGLIGAGGLVI